MKMNLREAIDDALIEFEPRLRLVMEALRRDEPLSADAARGGAIVLHEAWKQFEADLERLSAGSVPPEGNPTRAWGCLELMAEDEKGRKADITEEQARAFRLVADMHGGLDAFLTSTVMKEAGRLMALAGPTSPNGGAA